VESEQARRWVIGVLKADAAVGAIVGDEIYRPGEVLGVTANPVLFVSDITDTPWMTATGGVIVMDSVLVQLTAWGQEPGVSRTRLEDLIDAADAALHHQTGTSSGGDAVLSCVRERWLTLAPTTEEQAAHISRLDAEYRIQIQRAAAVA
jgi:hypothetical protein